MSIASPPPVQKKIAGVRDRHELRDPRCELERRNVGDVAEDVMRCERPQLRRDGVCDLLASVPDVREPEPCGRVEILGAVHVPDGRAFAAGEHELVTFDLSHRGKRVPEMGGGA